MLIVTTLPTTGIVASSTIVTSELATNAVRHAQTTFTVTLQGNNESVLLTATSPDGSTWTQEHDENGTVTVSRVPAAFTTYPAAGVPLNVTWRASRAFPQSNRHPCFAICTVIGCPSRSIVAT